MSTCNWPLGNGESLEFTIYNIDAKWNKVAGLYIFGHEKDQYWHALYIGQTDDFSERIPNHERLLEAYLMGATHIHALVVPDAINRNLLEQMLIQNIQPPMNTHYR